MTVNLLFGQADAGAVMRLVREQDVDVLSIQEVTPASVGRLDAAGARQRFAHRAVDDRISGAGSGLMARFPLDDPAPDDPTRASQPDARLRVPGAPALRVKAVHPRPPISGVSEREWRASLDRLPRPHGRGALRVLLGDFNATLDHRAFRALLDGGYVDAADATGEGLVWTWPRGRVRPKLTIDHVLLDARLGVRDVSVHPVPGTDHRAVVAELVLPRR